MQLATLLGVLFVIGNAFAEFSLEKNLLKSTISNEFMKVTFDEESLALTEISADFLGQGNYGTNLLVLPFQLEVSLPSASKIERRVAKSGSWLKGNQEGQHQFTAASTILVDSVEAISERWDIQLNENTRSFTVSLSGTTTSALTVKNLLYSVYVNNPSIYGLFDHGSFQMMNKEYACLGSDKSFHRAYFMGNGGALDVQIEDSSSTSPQNVFISTTSTSLPYKAGLQHVVAGNYPSIREEMELAWSRSCWDDAKTVDIPAQTNWTVQFTFTPNNYDFPAYLMNDIAATKENLDFTDLRTSLTGMYGSPMGCIQSFYQNHDGMIAPTIAHPDIGYSPMTNFFDPDNFISLSALIYSNDVYLLQEVKKILWKTGQTMCGLGSYQNPVFCQSKTATKNHQKGSYEVGFDSHSGQIMHHFINLKPDYNSIAGSVQLGPNIFWTLTCLRYLSVTQDNAFATDLLPYVELSTQFLLSLYDEKVQLLNSPGPLWIDVFVRENYTSDSNAMLVPYLQEVADFYDYMAYQPDRAMELRQLAKSIIAAMNTYLWQREENDHYVTQMNLDLTTTRDFVDYDSNLIALAFGVVGDEEVEKAQRIFKRIDSNPYAHARATWVSEKEYTGEPSDCYSGPVGNGLCGDSNMTMARIGWVDTLARKRFGDRDTYERLLLQPLQQDLIQNVWLTERYDQNGNAIRTPYYFEYAALVPIMLREVSYGIAVDLLTVTIDPLSYSSFDYKMGSMKISYHPEKGQVWMELPGDKTKVDELRVKVTTLHGFQANGSYEVVNSCFSQYNLQKLTASEKGVLSFPMKFASSCQVSVTALSR